MSFSVLPVFLAFVLNRCSISFFTSCRCILGFTPFSASMLYGMSLVAILVKHPELYPCWLRQVNVKIMFCYELIVSSIVIEIGFCIWNSVETLIFYKIPAYFEENCSTLGDYYILTVESPIGVSVISNVLALGLLLLTLHITRVCNFNLLLQKHGIHKFFADAGLTSKLCRHHKDMRQDMMDSDTSIPTSLCPSPLISSRDVLPAVSRMQTTNITSARAAKTLRSGKKFY